MLICMSRLSLPGDYGVIRRECAEWASLFLLILYIALFAYTYVCLARGT